MKIFDTHTHLNDEAFVGKTQQFIDNAEALGYSKAVVVGALYNQKEELTKAEFEKVVNSFLKKEAK